jgi:hypothetical protein
MQVLRELRMPPDERKVARAEREAEVQMRRERDATRRAERLAARAAAEAEEVSMEEGHSRARRIRALASRAALSATRGGSGPRALRTFVITSVVVVGALTAAGVAAACHSPPPVFHPSECVWNPPDPLVGNPNGYLYCETVLETSTYELVWTSTVEDPSCPNGERLIETTQVVEEDYITYGVFPRRAPVFCDTGNEFPGEIRVISTTTRDLGCV